MSDKKNLFFHKYSEDANGNQLNSCIVKTTASRTKKMLNGKEAYVRNQSQFCLLIITDEDGNTVDPREYDFQKDQELVGVVDSGSPVLDRDTKEPTGLNWAEFVG